MYVVLSESEIIVVYPSLVTGPMILHPIFSPTEAGTSAVWDFQLEIRILRSDPNKGKVFEFLESRRVIAGNCCPFTLELNGPMMHDPA